MIKRIILLICLCPWLVPSIVSAQQMVPVWNNTIGGPSWDIANALGTDADGNTMVAGTFTDSINIGKQVFRSQGHSDVFVAWYNSDGKLSGSTTIGGPGPDYALFGGYDGSTVLLIKHYGDMNIAAKKQAATGKVNYLVAWFDKKGELEQTQSISGDKGLEIAAMETDPSGAVHLAGWYTGDVDMAGEKFAAKGNETPFLATLKRNGKQTAATREKEALTGRVYALTTGKGKQLHLAGTVAEVLVNGSSTISMQHLYVATMGSNGKTEMHLPLLKGLELEPVSIKENGDHLWIASRYKHYCLLGNDTIFAKGQHDILMAKVPMGKGKPEFWSIGGYGNDMPLGLTLTGNQLVLAGSFADSLWFTPDNYLVSESYGSDVFIAAFDQGREPVRALSLGGSHNDFPCAVSAHGEAVYLLGQFKNTIETPAGKIETLGSYDVFVARYENCGAKPEVKIAAKQDKNAKGATVYSLSAPAGYKTYHWNNGLGFTQTASVQPGGTYTVEVTDQYGCKQTGKIDLTGNKSAMLADGQMPENREESGFVPFKLYPTVSNGTVYWQPGSGYPSDGATLKVYDSAGRAIQTATHTGGLAPTETQTLEMGTHPKGHYLVEITGVDYKKIEKVILK
jgi:hypothetical protein